MLTHCTLAHCTLGPLKKLCQGLQCVPLAQRSHWRGIWLSPSLVSVVCYRLQYMLRCTLRATLVTRGQWRLIWVLRGAPICNILYLPFIVVQLTLNLTINP